jgi:hypothetical protein
LEYILIDVGDWQSSGCCPLVVVLIGFDVLGELFLPITPDCIAEDWTSVSTFLILVVLGRAEFFDTS